MGKKVFIIGAGAVGMSIGSALKKSGQNILGIYDIDSTIVKNASEIIGTQGFGGALPALIKEAELVIVTVPDHSIEQAVDLSVGEQLYSSEQIWIHCSGHLNNEVFGSISDKVKGTGTMHPAFVFPPRKCTPIPEKIYFAVGGTEKGIEEIKLVVALLKGNITLIDPDHRPLYHAAMVMASNYIVTLLASANEILLELGMDEKEAEKLLFSLSSSAIDRSKKLGIDHSLSGPVRRGDVSVVEDHLKELDDKPRLKELYIAAGLSTVNLASRQSGYCQDIAQTLNEILNNHR